MAIIPMLLVVIAVLAIVNLYGYLTGGIIVKDSLAFTSYGYLFSFFGLVTSMIALLVAIAFISVVVIIGG